MLLTISIIGFFLTLVLLYFNISRFPTMVYLAGFFLLISLYYLNQYILFFSESVMLVSIFHLNFSFLYFLLGPLFYWYIRSVLRDDPRLKRSDWWHFLPMLFFLIATLPQLFTSWSEKIDAASTIVNDLSNLLRDRPAGFLKMFPWWLIYISTPVLLMGYMSWAAWLYFSYVIKRIPGILSGQLFMKKWLPVLFVCLSVFVVSQILMILEVVFSGRFDIFTSVNILMIISTLGITGLLVSPFFFPEALYGLPRIPENVTLLNPSMVQKEPSVDEHKKLMPAFEQNYLLAITQKADYCMKELKPYLQEDCNLANFARIIKIPAHHLGYYFREEKKQSYNDYRNWWRIDHAKSLIREGKAKEVTLDEIGYLSGFTSRNAFFAAFKKFEGISPGTFAAQFSA